MLVAKVDYKEAVLRRFMRTLKLLDFTAKVKKHRRSSELAISSGIALKSNNRTRVAMDKRISWYANCLPRQFLDL